MQFQWTFRESQRPQRFFSYIVLNHIIDFEPSNRPVDSDRCHDHFIMETDVWILLRDLRSLCDFQMDL